MDYRFFALMGITLILCNQSTTRKLGIRKPGFRNHVDLTSAAVFTDPLSKTPQNKLNKIQITSDNIEDSVDIEDILDRSTEQKLYRKYVNEDEENMAPVLRNVIKRLAVDNYIKQNRLRLKKKQLNQKNVELNQKHVELNQKHVELNLKHVELNRTRVELNQKNDELNQKNDQLNQKNDQLNQKNDQLNQKFIESERILVKYGEANRTVQDMNKTVQDINKTVQDMNKTAVTERQLRMFYHVLVDLGQILDQSLDFGYPPWAPPRPPRTFGEDIWRRFFCNIENPQVWALKVYLFKSKMSEELFIEIVQHRLLFMRNYAPINMLSIMERKKVYDNVISGFIHNEEQIIALRGILCSFGCLLDQKKESCTEVEQNAIDARNVYKFIRIPNLNTKYFTEPNLEQVFSSFFELIKNETNIILDYPVAFFLNWNGNYLLFEDFDAAYATWKLRSFLRRVKPLKSSFYDKPLNRILIVNETEAEERLSNVKVLKVMLCDNTKLEDFINHMNTFEPTPSQIRRTKQIEKKIEAIDKTIKSTEATSITPAITHTSKMKKEKTIYTSLFFNYPTLVDLLTAYQHCKEIAPNYPGVKVRLINELHGDGIENWKP